MQVAPKLHDFRVRKVQAQVKRWNEAGLRGKRTMCTARPSWLTMSTRTATFKEVSRCGLFMGVGMGDVDGGGDGRLPDFSD